jgi:hypothetical protein
MPNGFNSTTPSHIPNAVKIMGSLAVGTDASPNAVATSPIAAANTSLS